MALFNTPNMISFSVLLMIGIKSCFCQFTTVSNGFYVGVVSDTPIIWTEAETYCATEIGTSLASIHSEADNNNAVDVALLANMTGRIWLGGSDLVTEGTWVWTDGSPWDYENWAGINPNNGRGGTEHCLQFGTTTGQWNDLQCDPENTDLFEDYCDPIIVYNKAIEHILHIESIL